MKSGHVINSISRQAGGVFFSVRSLAEALAAQKGTELAIFGLEDRYSAEDAGQWAPFVPEVLPVAGPASLGFSPALEASLVRAGCDVLHTQGIWQGSSLAVHRWHRKTGRPYLISPHGMLDPWAVANSRWKKRVAGVLYEYRHLRDAACLHALCHSEAESIRAFGLRNPVAVIPNGVALPKKPKTAPSEATRPPKPKTERKTLLFLGRLHPKKGLVNMLRAWSASRGTRHEEWRLVIAGWNQGGHEAELKMLATELGIRWADMREHSEMNDFAGCSLLFAGPAFGETKDRLFREADAFILPSLSEGLPMAVLETWAYGLPVWMTDHCNLPEGFIAGAAFRIGTGVDDLVAGLASLFSASHSDLLTMGLAGRRLVEERFTWPKVARQMREVYEWMLGGGHKPETVTDR